MKRKEWIKRPACGYPDCGVSSDMEGHFTFGRGKLDDYGYWEHPCHPCARESEKEDGDGEKCWPFDFEQTQQEIERDVEDMVEDVQNKVNQTLVLLSEIMNKIQSLNKHSYSFFSLEGMKLCILDAQEHFRSIKRSK